MVGSDKMWFEQIYERVQFLIKNLKTQENRFVVPVA